MPVIPALGSQRQVGLCEFQYQGSWGYAVRHWRRKNRIRKQRILFYNYI